MTVPKAGRDFCPAGRSSKCLFADGPNAEIIRFGSLKILEVVNDSLAKGRGRDIFYRVIQFDWALQNCLYNPVRRLACHKTNEQPDSAEQDEDQYDSFLAASASVKCSVPKRRAD
jgi:hypothetical protein